MANVNIYYHKQTNSWWINSNMDGFSLRNYINENKIGLGTIELNTYVKSEIDGLNEIDSVFIPKHIKMLSGITEEIEENGFQNAIKVSDKELENILNKGVDN